MIRFALLLGVASAICTTASAGDTVLIGHVDRVIVQESGTEDCPPPCGPVEPPGPDGLQRVCVSNMGGCETIDVRVEQVLSGDAPDRIRTFRSRVGEWGSNLPVAEQYIAIRESGSGLWWSLVTLKDGKKFVDGRRLRYVPASAPAGREAALMPLDDLLAATAQRK